MPRYEYRPLKPQPAAEKAFHAWIDELDREFANRDVNHRSLVVRDALHRIYLGRPYADAAATDPLAYQALLANFDPRNATLEPEYYGDADAEKYAERKPLIWFWMMFDRSPAGLNHWLGFRMRRMLAGHVFKHCGKHVQIAMGVATKDIEPFHIKGGVPAKTLKIKTIAPEHIRKAAEKSG